MSQYPPTDQPQDIPPPPPPYGVPSSTVPSLHPMGDSLPPPAQVMGPPLVRRRVNGRMIAFLIVGLLVLVAFGGIFAYLVNNINPLNPTSPATTTKTYLDDIAGYRFTAAYGLICPDKQNASLKQQYDQAQQITNLPGFNSFVISTNEINYTIQDQGTSSAHVLADGTVRISTPFTSPQSQHFNKVFPLAVHNGQWCLEIGDLLNFLGGV